MPIPAGCYGLAKGVEPLSGPFFEELGLEGCARIEAVAMDMNTAFDLGRNLHRSNDPGTGGRPDHWLAPYKTSRSGRSSL